MQGSLRSCVRIRSHDRMLCASHPVRSPSRDAGAAERTAPSPVPSGASSTSSTAQRAPPSCADAPRLATPCDVCRALPCWWHSRTNGALVVAHAQVDRGAAVAFGRSSPEPRPDTRSVRPRASQCFPALLHSLLLSPLACEQIRVASGGRIRQP